MQPQRHKGNRGGRLFRRRPGDGRRRMPRLGRLRPYGGGARMGWVVGTRIGRSSRKIMIEPTETQQQSYRVYEQWKDLVVYEEPDERGRAWRSVQFDCGSMARPVRVAVPSAA